MNDDKDGFEKLFRQALAIEAEEAKQAGAIGFMARVLTQVTMPHRQIHEPVFKRKNGAFSLAMLAHPDIGLPYGSIPRLLLAWMTTEAVRTRSPMLELGPSLSAFMAGLGLTRCGGEKGDITRFRNQALRLFCSTVSCRYEDKTLDAGGNLSIVEQYSLWWNPKTLDPMPLWKSTVTLGSGFFNEIVDRPVPVDMRALRALKRSPLALDIYCWLTYRLSYLRKPTDIPWAVLQLQFGADYGRERDFKAAFLEHLRAVLVVYPEADVGEGQQGLLLKPSKPHVAHLPPPALPRLKNPPPPEPLLPPWLDFQEQEPELQERRGPFLKTQTYEMAKKAAPKWDVYELERQWREWIGKKGIPQKPDAAFIAFCRKKAAKENP